MSEQAFAHAPVTVFFSAGITSLLNTQQDFLESTCKILVTWD